MAKKNITKESIEASVARIKALLTEKGELAENLKAFSTWLGASGLGALGIFSPGLHAAIGGFGSTENIFMHVGLGAGELGFFLFSTYMTFKKPITKVIL